MAFPLAHRSTARVLAGLRHSPSSLYSASHITQRRSLFNFFRRSKQNKQNEPPEPVPLLTEDNLVHPFSRSPFPQVRARGEVICSMAPCPVCAASHSHTHAHIQAQPKTVKFECPDCGWPTHCSEEHWKEDKEHEKYCSRLREANEDEHDLRSGRRMPEFELPGPQGYEETISFANWDVFWYTRGFNSMDSERSRRHASKLLTYPMTIGSVLHQYSSLMLNNQRLTPEGSRSMAAIRSTLHTEPGAPETHEASVGKPQVRIFVLGARAESSLPPHVWEQLGFLFPAANFHVHFIGPQTSLPRHYQPQPKSASPDPTAEAAAAANPETKEAQAESTPETVASSTEEEKPLYTPNVTKSETEVVPIDEKKPLYTPNVYSPPTPAPIPPLKWTRSSLQRYGVPSYTTPYSYQMTLSGLQSNYADVHHLFEETLDPYSDVFFFFSPGFGFPSPTSVDPETGEPLLQISSPTEWGPVLPMLLASKCPIFVTGFSPADVERDIKSLSTAPGVAGEFEWVVTPGPNPFGSEKWEVADFDPRVMVKTNWGIWAIRGKSRDIQERSFFSSLFSNNSSTDSS
ncbi:translational activator for mitochondrial COX1 [Stygiomarasmius scandens]|uniref:Translational activator for mitochondrial COX1 n=1 Tax=Marasmiellus scandens TaxID=2682957 RepID=A0ABR1J3S3_9AGAR